jgi:hypothetical protein
MMGGQQTQGPMDKPLFTTEGPEFYERAYKHNAPYSLPGPYMTKLTPSEEKEFRQWLKATGNPGGFDPDAAIQDYDQRGFWLNEVKHPGTHPAGIDPIDKRLHGPDLYKTPYDTTFSGESKYAKPGTPFKWQPGDRLIDTRTGQLIFAPEKKNNGR